jgi:hypothetical protein
MKTIKHSTKPKKVSKAAKRKEMEAELTLNNKGAWKIPKALLIKFGEDLLLMFNEDKRMISMLAWRQKHDLSYFNVNKHCKACPELKEMIEEFKERAGLRIFEQSVVRGDTSMARFALTMYSKDYRQSEKWRNNLRKEIISSAQEKATINVYMPDFGFSGKVPDKSGADKINPDKGGLDKIYD